MINLTQFLTHLMVYIGLATFFLLALVLYNPRLMLQDYPPAIQAIVPPKTTKEKQQTWGLGMPFLLILLILPFFAVIQTGEKSFSSLFLHSFGLAWGFNVWDWLILDWLLFCTITPKAFVIPGSEGHPAYKDYAFHFRGFLIGTIFSLVMGLIVATIVYFIRLV